MSRVLFSVWISIKGIIEKRPAASGSGFNVLVKNVQGIIQRLGIIQTTCSVWFRIQRIIK